MTDELVLEQLRRILAVQDRIEFKIGELTLRMGQIEGAVARLSLQLARVGSQLAEQSVRLDRVGNRLDLMIRPECGNDD